MEIKTALASGIEITAGETEYDTSCKRVLAEKHVLARILHGCTVEFRDFDIETIVKECFGGHMYISAVPIAPDETGAFLQGSDVGLTSPTEGSVYFDILFDALVPSKDESVRLLVNVEAQSDFYPGYSLLQRGMYYCGRLLSAQNGTVFSRSHYEKLCKVYSIWICLHPPKSRQNTITRYYVAEDSIIGQAKDDVSHYDLLSIVVVCLGYIEDENCRGLLRLLSVLLSSKMMPDDKKQILSGKFNIPMTQTLDREVASMCNLGHAVFVEGVEQGRSEGRSEGLAEGRREGHREGHREGRREGILSSVRSLMKSMNLSVNEALNALEIPAEERQSYIDALAQA
ncbi:MAG: hypothetical protein K6E42_06575 [Synergistes sp.]|nr:hypothetical protein [Synergistes sp.]